jgi:uncharacterized membrane protein YccC
MAPAFAGQWTVFLGVRVLVGIGIGTKAGAGFGVRVRVCICVELSIGFAPHAWDLVPVVNDSCGMISALASRAFTLEIATGVGIYGLHVGEDRTLAT